jgi:nicotinate-nucleotide pyrophosphorylase (carboxylating)
MRSLTGTEILLDDNVDEIIKIAIDEDVFSGDITTENIVSADGLVDAVIVAKEGGVIAGITIAERVFKYFDSDISFSANYKDGDSISNGDEVVKIRGQHKAVLAGERTALNFLQRMSGIATKTSHYVNAVKNTSTRILDTRKTLPGLRLLDKYSVKCGGGVNHRIGLYDMVMIKDNHIKVAGSITEAVSRIRERLSDKYKIEVETTSLDEVREAVENNVDIIMLDNMSIDEMKKAVQLINKRALAEASGNMTLERVGEVAECGVDFISVGALTHSVNALDLSLGILI